MQGRVILGISGALFCQVILLMVAGWHNRYVIDNDAIAYIRIAGYYLHGQFDLAVSGYWGPLLSWMMVPWLAFVENTVDAARIAMGLSAIIFLLSCVAIFQNLDLHPAGVILGAWIVAAASIYWSVEFVTPDLLMSGFLGFAISRLVSESWIGSRSTPLMAGIWLGIAYFAKPIAFLMAFILSVGISILWVRSRVGSITQVLRSLAITLLSFLCLASPWVLILSHKYHHLTFTTSGTINHALVGPPDEDRYHPFRRKFHIPEPGRITSWEDPSHMPYKYWSPFDNMKNIKYQLFLIYRNYQRLLNVLNSFDMLGIGLFALVSALLFHKPWSQNLGAERWRWGGGVVICLSGLYLLLYSGEKRYHYPAYPFLLVASIGMINWLTHTDRSKVNLPRIIGFGLVVCSFAFPIYLQLPSALTGLKHPSILAYHLAKKLETAHIYGPLAGVDRKEGLFVAFFLNQPWYGEEQHTTMERLKQSQAKLFVIDRHSPLLSELDRDPLFRNLETVLFPSGEEVQKFPWKIYQIINLESKQ